MDEMATFASAPSRPPYKRLSRIAGMLGVFVALIALVAVAAPWLFSTIALRDEIMTQIRQMTGLVATSQGHAVFVVLPQPHLSIDDIGFADPSGALRIDARYLKGYLRVTALLRGRLEIASVVLGEPKMVIDLNGRPLPSDSAIGRAANAKSASPQATSADEARLGVVSLVNGSARLQSKLDAFEVTVDAINVKVDWRKLGAAASVSGRARFRGQTADIAAVIAHPTELLRGEQSAVRLKIEGPAISLSTSGSLASAPRPQYTGHIVASTPSVRKLVETGGYYLPLPGLFNDLSLDSDVSIDASSAAFSSLRLSLDGNDLEGALAVHTGEQTPILSGTLATSRLSLRPFLANVPRPVGHDGQWSRDLFDLGDHSLADLDLRVSSTHLFLQRIEMEDAAFSLMKRNGRLDFTLAQAKVFQGSIRGRASFVLDEAGLTMRANGSVAGVDVASLWPIVGSGKISGSMTGTANVESTGASMSELMRNLDGRAQIALERGELGGINLEQALRRLDKRPLALATDVRHGETAFESASFGLRIAKGVAEIESGVLRNPRVSLGFGGGVDFAERALNLHALATAAASEDKAGQESPRFGFDVVGPWDDLAFVPDVQSLIRHSGAAAPLFIQKPGAAKPLANERKQ
jgi:AsmA protein